MSESYPSEADLSEAVEPKRPKKDVKHDLDRHKHKKHKKEHKRLKRDKKHKSTSTKAETGEPGGGEWIEASVKVKRDDWMTQPSLSALQPSVSTAPAPTSEVSKSISTVHGTIRA